MELFKQNHEVKIDTNNVEAKVNGKFVRGDIKNVKPVRNRQHTHTADLFVGEQQITTVVRLITGRWIGC